MIYRFAIEEVISSYYPIIDKINSQLEQIEDYVILEKPTKSQLSDILMIRRKISFLESTSCDDNTSIRRHYQWNCTSKA